MIADTIKAMAGVLRSLLILGGTVAGVLVATLALTGMVAPAPVAMASPTATPAPSFDLAVAPTVVGGLVTVTGDRTSTFELDHAFSELGWIHNDESAALMIETDYELRGPDGRIAFDRDDGSVSQIEYDGLAFYLDPGDCEITKGVLDEVSGLTSARLVCADLADIRDKGVISLDGIIGIPEEILGRPEHIPAAGGTIEVNGSPMTFPTALTQFYGLPSTDPEFPLENFDLLTGVGYQGIGFGYDAESEAFFLTAIFADADGIWYSHSLDEPCPLPAERLGDLGPRKWATRLTFDCTDVTLDDGTTATVTGTVVVDFIQMDVVEPDGP